MSALSERLGFSPTERVVLVTCDELGFSHEANEAIFAALRSASAGSASLMVPAPWARGAAAGYRGEDVGAQLTLNAELDLYRWAPITSAPSLLDGDGGFPRTVADVWDHADLDEVRREWRAQIERGIYWGFDVSHLDVHLDGVELKPEFFDVYLDLAEELLLPIRLPAKRDEMRVGFPFRSLATERGVVSPDEVTTLAAMRTGGSPLEEVLADLVAGVTEIRTRPAVETAALRTAAPDWLERVEDARSLEPGGPLVTALDRLGITRVGYRALRQLMRAGAGARRGPGA